MPLKGNAEAILVYEMKHFSALATQRSKTRCKLICSYHCLDEPIFIAGPKPTRTEIGINWRIVSTSTFTFEMLKEYVIVQFTLFVAGGMSHRGIKHPCYYLPTPTLTKAFFRFQKIINFQPAKKRSRPILCKKN